MKRLFLGLLLVTLMTFCSTNTDKEKESTEANKRKDLILGIWTDGAGPNASFRIESDSIYNVELFDAFKYQLDGDTLIIYYEGELFKSKIKKLDADSLIYLSGQEETKMWRFKD